MILAALDTLYDRLEPDHRYGLAPPGFSMQKISFKVVLKPDGSLFGIQDTRQPDGGRLRARRVRVLGTTKPPGSALNPCFLWDNCSYMLGLAVGNDRPERAAQAFSAFRERHLGAQGSIRSPRLDAVCTFLSSWRREAASDIALLQEVGGSGFGLFQIVGETGWVHEDPKIEAWWLAAEAARSAEPTVMGQCLVTGRNAPIARLHEKIKNIAGGQGAGAPIVGVNADAFESYGREQSFNAPVSQEAAFRYGSALNALLDGPMSNKHRLLLGDMTVAFWTGKPSAVEDVFASFAAEGSLAFEAPEGQDETTRAKLEAFLNAMRQGREAYAELQAGGDTDFYVLGLSPNAGRVSVRLFLHSSLRELLDNLRRHHADIGLVPQGAAGRHSADPEFPPAWLLLRQTARQTKDVPPVLAGPLLRAILTGSPYPQALFTAVVRRIRADQAITYLRAAVLKGYLTRNLNQEVSMSLDTVRQDPAYRLGRLFSALEKTQRDALGERLNTTIRDSFYGAASATPATVFPRLLRVYQHHLAKLEGGRRVNREKLVQEILDPLSGFPAHLGLTDQGLFAIGYYHQTRDFYTKRTEPEAN